MNSKVECSIAYPSSRPLTYVRADTVPSQMHSEIFATLLVFLSSANREIVKSILGYIKLAIHTMPPDLLRPHLDKLVPALLGWSHDHKNHFKEKVRHIFERMLRRFGWEDIYSHAEQEDARKFLLNIKKRKDRAKRKKNREADNEAEEVRAEDSPIHNLSSTFSRIIPSKPLRAEMPSKTSCTAAKANSTTVTTRVPLYPSGVTSVKEGMLAVPVLGSTMMTQWIFCLAQRHGSRVSGLSLQIVEGLLELI